MLIYKVYPIYRGHPIPLINKQTVLEAMHVTLENIHGKYDTMTRRDKEVNYAMFDEMRTCAGEYFDVHTLDGSKQYIQ